MIGLIVQCQTSLLTRSSHTPQPQSKLRKLAAVAQLAVLLTLTFVFTAINSSAQSTATGTLVGTVTDPQGAVVPGASVAITDRSINTTTKTTTNSAGHYAFVNVNPGTYDVKITKQGFQTALVQGQVVEVGKQLTEDVRLPVGAVTQEVTVETTGTELQTLNATVGNTVTGVALDSLPTLGRDVSTFVTLQPGVSPDGSVAGTVVDQSSFQLDGGQNTNDMDGSMSVYTPSFAGDPTGGVSNQSAGVAAGPTGVMPTPADSVEEFKVNTANQTADFNSSSGAQVQVVTKRGTNTYHGTVYEYYLDNNWNANTWQNKHVIAPRPIIKQPNYHYSRFGASFGGPLIPKDILGGKTYFFANYQGFRWPNSQTIEKTVPTDSMRLGLIYDTVGNTFYNLNATPVTYKGTTYQPAACPLSANGRCDPRGIGINPLISQLWSKYEPLPNESNCGLSRCDVVPASGLGNVGGFKANVGIPQNDNFGVFRLDHDFGQKFHFNATYHYYRLIRGTIDQVDIGGFFTGDKLGTPTSLSNRPQVPWLYTAGLSTNITNNLTNDFHYSFLRNWWAWSTREDVPQFSQLGGALEPFGESRDSALIPYNVNTQQTRTRFWDGMDHYFRDDLTLLKGNHLFQFGGQYQHNFNWHQRTDNGGGINYMPVYQLGTSSGAGIAVSDYIPDAYSGSTKNYGRDYAAILGIVSASQIAFTRTGNNLQLNPPHTPAFDKSTIPYYNVYFSDSWHLKPSFTLTYGLGWTLEMPPVEQSGKQVEFVDQANQPIDVQAYIASRERAALQGQVYNPIVGFSLIGNTANSPKYPYNPFYGSFSPRVAAAWNPHFGGNWMGKVFGEDKSVLRAGYGRIYGRLNGVDLVLVPLLGTGLIQPVQCIGTLNPAAGGGCGGSSATPVTAFRIGTDGNSAPLGTATATLPQPDFPGINALPAGAGEALDPHFRPNVVDSFDVTLQRQLSNKVTMELGYIGRIIKHEYQPINVNAVPHMMTLGGQSFAKAYAAVETATGFGNSIPKTVTTNGVKTVPGISAQPFFESALNAAYCAGYSSCTAAVVDKEGSNFGSQAVWDLWSDLDNGGTKAGFNFPFSMLNTAGQLSSGVGVNASIGHGNYNAGFATIRMSDWKGLTLQSNFTWSKALGTGALVQATSEYTADDPFNLDTMYGLQAFDRKFVYNMFVIYQSPFFKGQQGLAGHLLGGWTIAPIFAAGSGEPIPVNTVNGTSEAFGAGDALNFFDNENGVLVSPFTGGHSRHDNVKGSNGVGTGGDVNMFANPSAVLSEFRNPILGLDTNAGGFGVVRGLPYWNMDLSIKKNIRITERISTEFQTVFTNVLNHMQMLDPTLDMSNPATFGVLTGQEANSARKMEFGLRVIF